MSESSRLALSIALVLAAAALPAPLAAQGWLTQTHEVSARLEADAETLAFPTWRNQALVLPEDLPEAEVCVDFSASTAGDDGGTRVRVLISRLGEGGGESTVQDLVFTWRQSDPPPVASRCQPAGDLLAGDVVEFRFRFFGMPPLELLRRGRRITTLPVLIVRGVVRHDPFSG